MDQRRWIPFLMRRLISWTWKCLEVVKCYQKIFKTFCNEIILRFPFTALENGGGAFVSSCTYYVIQLKLFFPNILKLLPYLIILIFVGRPLYFMELLLGQFSSRKPWIVFFTSFVLMSFDSNFLLNAIEGSCVGVYDMSPAMRGIGVAQLISTCIVTTYYASLMGLTISYFFASMNDPLPWR